MSRQPVVCYVVGARPNYMKIAPIHQAMAEKGTVEQVLIHTGQHYDKTLSDAFFAELPLPHPSVMLGVGSGSQAVQTSRALVRLERAFVRYRPDVVVVPGDVNSTLAGALAAAKLGIAVCHVEAGLRSFDTTMPEEHNRVLTDHLSDLLLTHSEDADRNLAAEGVDGVKVRRVGNTMIDTLLAQRARAETFAAWSDIGLDRSKYVLVTLHRPSLVDDPELLRETFLALHEVSRDLPVVFPVHPRTSDRLNRLGLSSRQDGFLLTPPLPYRQFLSLELGAAAVITDSGGVQEETTVLGVPCFTLRANTERPVTVNLGTNVLLGLQPSEIATVPTRLRDRREFSIPPLWDGQAGVRAADEIERFLSPEPRSRQST
jgi:UDP-N-acetylglucosamine 2-epimerase (non-hydrolysing)